MAWSASHSRELLVNKAELSIKVKSYGTMRDVLGRFLETFWEDFRASALGVGIFRHPEIQGLPFRMAKSFLVTSQTG